MPRLGMDMSASATAAAGRLWQLVLPRAKAWWRHLRWPVLLFAGVAILKDLVFRVALTSALTSLLGAQVSARSASIHVLKPGISIHRLEVAQPGKFTDGKLMRLRDLYVRLDVAALMRGQIHVPELVLKFQEVHVIRNAQKQLNVDALKIMEDAKKPSEKPGNTPAELPRFQIDRAVLSVERVVYTDYTKIKNSRPKVEVFDQVVKEKTFENVTSVRQLALAVLSQAIGPTAIKSTAIAGAAILSGVGLLPVGVLAVAVAKNSASQTFLVDSAHLFDEIQAFLRESGSLKNADKKNGTLEAIVQGHRVRVAVERLSGRVTKVTLSARKYLIPKPRFAAGLLYQLDQRIDD